MKKALYSILLLALSSYWVQAQQTDTVQMKNKNVFISTGYKPIIYDADMITSTPKLVALEKKEKSLEFLIFPNPLEIGSVEIDNLPYVRMKPSQSASLESHFLKARLGTYLNSNLLYSYGTQVDSSIVFGVKAAHQSRLSDFNSPQAKVVTATEAQSGVGLYFLKHRLENVFFCNIDYQNHQFNYYGFNDQIDSLSENNEVQAFHRLKLSFNLNSNKLIEEHALKYKNRVDYGFFYTANQNAENHILFRSSISKLFEEKPFEFLPRAYQYYFDFGFAVNYFNYEIDPGFKGLKENNSSLKENEFSTTNTKLGILFSPTFRMQSEKLRVKIGGELDIYSGVQLSNVKVYPNVELSYLPYKELFVFTLGADGETQLNAIANLTLENPYLNQLFVPEASYTNSNFFTAMSFNFNENVSWRNQLSYSMQESALFFVNDSLAVNKFNASTDEAQVFKLSSNLSLDMGALKLDGTLNFFQYSLTNLAEAWHRPQFQLQWLASYQFDRELLIRTELKSDFGIKARDPLTSNSIHLDPILNLNVEAQYRYSTNVFWTARIDNLLNTSFSKYNYYYQPGFSFNLGLVAKF